MSEKSTRPNQETKIKLSKLVFYILCCIFFFYAYAYAMQMKSISML